MPPALLSFVIGRDGLASADELFDRFLIDTGCIVSEDLANQSRDLVGSTFRSSVILSARAQGPPRRSRCTRVGWLARPRCGRRTGRCSSSQRPGRPRVARRQDRPLPRDHALRQNDVAANTVDDALSEYAHALSATARLEVLTCCEDDNGTIYGKRCTRPRRSAASAPAALSAA
jgi:hypothetical protein